jgi:ABC-2 type transport system permease protein
MSELGGLYAIWYREFKVFTREKSRIISSIINPLLWLVIFGGGLGSTISIQGVNYQSFIFPGMLAMVAMFSTIFFGAYVVWDKKIDFLKEVLVAPLTRTTIFFGKVLGGLTDTLIQVTILLVLGLLLGLGSFALHQILLAYVFIFIFSVGLVSVGLILGSTMDSPEGFQLITSFVIFPLFFLSGALFPINNLPAWLSFFTKIDPVTYAVDGLRGAMLGVSVFPAGFNLLVLSLFSIVAVFIGVQAFKRMKI